jgi:glycosyltransferase involved in cell wall biosynthesis
MDKIRVAFFAEILLDDFDGASRTIFHIINRIPRESYDYHFFCGVPSDKPFPFPVHLAPTITIPFNHSYKMALPLWKKRSLIAALDQMKPQVIHISTPSPLGWLGLAYAQKHKIPVITIYHTHFVSYVQFYLKKLPFLIKPVERMIIRSLSKFYNQADVIYVPNQLMIDALEGYGVSLHKMKAWPRALNEGVFSPSKRDLHWRKIIDPNDKPILLYASRLVWEKNVQALIDLYKRIENCGLDVNVVVVGDGVAKDAMVRQMPKAHFLGHQDHESLSMIYASCDVFVFPSISESYGNVVIEAMASGLPCVIANGGGSAAFIDNGENGFSVTYDKPDEYVDAIRSILDNDQLKQQFIDKGIVYAKTLTWESLIKQYLEDINQLSKKL